jgi:hypothetical protein
VIVSKSYEPSSLDERRWFTGLWCDNCVRGYFVDEEEGPDCDILFNSAWYKPGQPDYPKEWIYDERGQPTCTAFEPIGEPSC